MQLTICCSLNTCEALVPAQECSSGVGGRGWPQSSLTGSLLFWQRMSNRSFPRMVLVRMQIWATDARPVNLRIHRLRHASFSALIPCRLRSSTALVPFAQPTSSYPPYWSAFAGGSRRSHGHQSGVNWHQTFSHVSLPILPIMSTPSLYSHEHASSPVRLGS